VIAEAEVMPLLVRACPSFRADWDRYLAELGDDERLIYIELGSFAHHLVDLMKAGTTAEFAAVFAEVERLHVDGAPDVQEAATIGLLEGIQNVAGNRDLDPERFLPFLGPESTLGWNQLNDFWDRKIPYVGAGLAAKKPDA
jgi:hypothetical protein